METDSVKTNPRVGFARNTARNLLKTINQNNPPILLNPCIKHLGKGYDLSVYAWNFGENIDGIVQKNGEQITIGYNELQHVHRQRFTVAHEIGHLLMGHISNNADYNLESKHPKEIEANQFAAELLMPLAMLKNDVSNGLNDVKVFAKKYLVSEEAMWWRVLECQLLSQL